VVRTTPALKRRIERAASADERTLASWVRRALLAALDNNSAAQSKPKENA
jgi:hypothetical protein